MVSTRRGLLCGAVLATAVCASTALPPAGPPPRSALFACDSGPVHADFDDNRVDDSVARADEPGTAALQVVLNGSRLVLLDAPAVCRLQVADLDGDRDADLVALSTAGDLEVWRNDAGALRLLAPQAASHAPVVRARARLEPSSVGLAALPRDSVGAPTRLVSRVVRSTSSGVELPTAPSVRRVYRDPHLARPPPTLLSL